MGREACEAALLALEVADTYCEDRPTAVLAAGTVEPRVLAAGFVTLVRTLRRKIADDHQVPVGQVTAAVRRQLLAELERG